MSRWVSASFLVFSVGCGAGVALVDQSGRTTYVSSASRVPSGYVATPHGYYHQSCVHQQGGGDANTPCDHPRVLVLRDPSALSGPTTNGWVIDAQWTSPTPVTQMTSHFWVPDAPTAVEGQLVYFFPGMEPSNGTIILQPVLQWGVSPAGGGNKWSIASWSCGPSCVHGNLVDVQPGDEILGTISGANCSVTGQCDWTIVTQDTNTGATATLNTTNDQDSYVWIQSGVLEAYNVSQCGDYPGNGSTTFADVSFTDVNGNALSPAWSPISYNTQICTLSVDISPTSAVIRFVDPNAADAGTPPPPPPPPCQYNCADYGYTAGQCFNGWACDAAGQCLSPSTSC